MNSRKTKLVWIINQLKLKRLEQKLHSEAVKNLIDIYNSKQTFWDAADERDALYSTFSWDGSPQGHEYWRQIHKKSYR